jgi:cytochrome c peroxidase
MASTWEQVLGRLRADRDLARRFDQAYAAGLTPASVSHALAEFERSLPAPSRFDRWLLGDDGALDEDELAGYRLFKKHGCSGCHQGRNVGGNLYQRFGVMAAYFAGTTPSKADLGRFNVTGREEDRHVFKVPSLRNVARTAPYFHDASALHLEDAVRVMGRHQLGMDLSAGDIAQIVAFLRTLDSEPAP